MLLRFRGTVLSQKARKCCQDLLMFFLSVTSPCVVPLLRQVGLPRCQGVIQYPPALVLSSKQTQAKQYFFPPCHSNSD